MSSVVCKRKILLPQYVNMSKWAVVACDQFTAQPEYWKALDEYVGEAPSTLRLILPEIYLQKDNSERVSEINEMMYKYLGGGVFRSAECFVLTERTMADGGKRLGLIVTVDLDAYDYHRVRTEIRATEETLPERLPVRIKIRKNAPIELPHILLLIDDKKKSVIEPLYQRRNEWKKIYDFDLNMDGGHIVGYQIDQVDDIIASFDALLDPALQTEKYGYDAGIELAVGDGNHSMAAAKECWEKIKKRLPEEKRKDHPARYALVEVVNLYDEELVFEPINRVVMGCGQEMIEELTALLTEQDGKGQSKVSFLFNGQEKEVFVKETSGRTIQIVQEYLERPEHKKWRIEYVHGYQHTVDVANAEGGIGIVMPLFEKSELFDYVVNVGNLPKKSFSLGTAESKKYYIEAKEIKDTSKKRG